MDWTHFVAVCILTLCNGASGATTISYVTLVDGQTPNEGRVEYITSDASTWQSACGDGLGYREASIICRQLGYPGVNNYVAHWPYGVAATIAQHRLNCDGENLADCSLLALSHCSDAGGVICYESGYLGCYLSSELALGDLQNPCEYGLDGSDGSTISGCISLCQGTNATFAYAGLYYGDTCLCGHASANISQSGWVDYTEYMSCSSPCAGRNIERCGGASHIALFNITEYLQNTMEIADPIRCADSSSTAAGVPSTAQPMPVGMSSMVDVSSPQDAVDLITPQDAFSVTSNPTPSIHRFVTSNEDTYSHSPGRTTSPETYTCLENSQSACSCGVQTGLIAVVVVLVLYAVSITVLLIHLRRKVVTTAGKNEPDPYMDLQPRKQADTTYQDVAVSSSTVSNNLPPSDLVYENQNVANIANKMKKSAY